MEDLFAEAVAPDFGEAPTDLRSRLMGAVATNGLLAVYQWWYPRSPIGDYNRTELSELEATYLIKLLDVAQTALGELPQPPGELRRRRATQRPCPRCSGSCGPLMERLSCFDERREMHVTDSAAALGAARLVQAGLAHAEFPS